jgi:pyruvate formate lyase activating enzyme
MPSSQILSFGTVGCNFTCKFCQNSDISQYPKEHNYEVYGNGISPDEIVALAARFKVDSIAYTYNEPAVFFEYAYDTAELTHEAGLKNVFVTSGYETYEALTKIKPYLDAMNIDLKSFREEFYDEICGAKLKPVLKCIKDAYSMGIWLEITTLLIEGKNDSDEEIRDIANFIASIDKNIPLHLSAFYPKYKMNDVKPTSKETLIRAHNIAKDAGLKYVYIGNFDDPKHLNTYCPKCGVEVIRRAGRLGEKSVNLLDHGYCTTCGYKVSGIWV